MNVLRLVPRFRNAERSFAELSARQAWSRQQVENYQLARLNEVWEHARQHVPYYRRLSARDDLPSRFQSLAQFQAALPVLPREQVRDSPMEFASTMRQPGCWRATSGSTGVPTCTYWSHRAHQEVLHAKYHFYNQWNVGVFDRMAFLWGNLSPPRSGLAGPVDRAVQRGKNWLRNRIHLSAHDLARDNLRRYLDRIEAFRPAAVYGFSGALHLLALEAESQGWHCDSLRAVFLAGEPAYPQIVRTIERVFRVPSVNEYGSCECGFLAGQQPDGKLRVREDLALLETVARNDGRYDIVVSVLTNACFPLLRYALGDVTEAPLTRPASGFAVLDGVSGRNNDVIITGTGRCLHPGRLAAIFETNQQIRRFRLHQDATGGMAASVEFLGEARHELSIDLERQLRDLAEGFPVSVQVVPSLPDSPSGKHRFISSDMVVGS